MAKRNVSYVKPPDPSFLQKIKERIGYEEGPTIETKKQPLPVGDNDDEDREDEKPVVVVLKPGDLTQEQAESLMKEENTTNEPETGRIVFRKSAKRHKDNPLITSSKKSKLYDERNPAQGNQSKKGIKNTSLLSFDEEEG